MADLVCCTVLCCSCLLRRLHVVHASAHIRARARLLAERIELSKQRVAAEAAAAALEATKRPVIDVSGSGSGGGAEDEDASAELARQQNEREDDDAADGDDFMFENERTRRERERAKQKMDRAARAQRRARREAADEDDDFEPSPAPKSKATGKGKRAGRGKSKRRGGDSDSEDESAAEAAAAAAAQKKAEDEAAATAAEAKRRVDQAAEQERKRKAEADVKAAADAAAAKKAAAIVITDDAVKPVAATAPPAPPPAAPSKRIHNDPSFNAYEFGVDAMWTDKYKPMTVKQLAHNRSVVTELKDWLQKRRTTKPDGFAPSSSQSSNLSLVSNRPNRKKSSKSGDDFVVGDYDYYSDEDFERPPPSKHKQRAKSIYGDDVLDDDDYYGANSVTAREKEEAGVASAIVLVGPCGVAKTASVYAVAMEQRWAVLEFNASQRRSQRDIITTFGEATQSHRIQMTTGEPGALAALLSITPFSNTKAAAMEVEDEPVAPAKPKGIAAFFGGGGAKSEKKAAPKPQPKKKAAPAPSPSPPPTPSPPASQTTLSFGGTPIAATVSSTAKAKTGAKDSLILFEEIDVVFEKADANFARGMRQLMKTSKRPILLTCNGMGSRSMQLPVPAVGVSVSSGACGVWCVCGV